MKIKKKLYIFSNYLPLQIWTLKICNHDVSKTITASMFNLGQLMSRSIGENFKKIFFIFFELSPLQIWTLKICNHDISKTITARSFKLGQLIEDDE